MAHLDFIDILPVKIDVHLCNVPVCFCCFSLEFLFVFSRSEHHHLAQSVLCKLVLVVVIVFFIDNVKNDFTSKAVESVLLSYRCRGHIFDIKLNFHRLFDDDYARLCCSTAVAETISIENSFF